MNWNTARGYPCETLTVGDYEIETVDADGHTPGNFMFWIEKEKIMFTGDHVLFDITPNITAWETILRTLAGQRPILWSLPCQATAPVAIIRRG